MKKAECMYTKIYMVVDLLINSSTEFITSSQLSNQLGISARMVFRYMKTAREHGSTLGFKISSFKGKGYQIQVTDKEQFLEFTKKYGRHGLSLQDETLLWEVLKRILLIENCKMDDLAELFNYSRSRMSKITIAANSYLEPFGLSLTSKPYSGLSVSGDEISIRDCMFRLYEETLDEEELWRQFELKGISFIAIQNWLTGWLAKEKINAAQKERTQFLKYLAITMKRISQRKEINFGYLANLADLELLQRNMKNISEMLIEWFPDRSLNGESMYLALIQMQTFQNEADIHPMKEHNMIFFHNLVMEALEKIRHNYGVDLSRDEFLVYGLTFHVASNYGKYLLHMETENPFYEELQKSYPTAFYYSIELAECISKYTNANMSNSELGFLIMHFASSMERNLGVRKWKTALLGDGAFGSSLLLKSRIEKHFEMIEVIGIYPYRELKLLPKNVDFYISPVRIRNGQQYDHEVLQLSPLLNKEDQELVEQLLSKLQHKSNSLRITEVCSRERFFIWNKPRKKKMLLANLCHELWRLGCMKLEDEEALFAREALVSTEIASNIAMPHCLIDGESFISFVLLDTPMIWGRTMVRLVILVCIKKGDTRFKEVLERLFQMIREEKNVQKLISCTSYDEFIEYIEEFEGGRSC